MAKYCALKKTTAVYPWPIINSNRRIQDKNALFSFCSTSSMYLHWCSEQQPAKGLLLSTARRAAGPASETNKPGFGREDWKMSFCTRADVRTLIATWHSPDSLLSITLLSLWHTATEMTVLLVNSQQCNTTTTSHMCPLAYKEKSQKQWTVKYCLKFAM